MYILFNKKKIEIIWYADSFGSSHKNLIKKNVEWFNDLSILTPRTKLTMSR